MNIGDRIKKRRLELELSVEELAKRIDKNKTTIYRYESNEILNLPANVLAEIADALRTTPAALMGWEEISAKAESVNMKFGMSGDFNVDFPTTENEQNIIRKYRQLDELSKKHIEDVIDLELDRTITTIAAHADEDLTKEDQEEIISLVKEELSKRKK